MTAGSQPGQPGLLLPAQLLPGGLPAPVEPGQQAGGLGAGAGGVQGGRWKEGSGPGRRGWGRAKIARTRPVSAGRQASSSVAGEDQGGQSGGEVTPANWGGAGCREADEVTIAHPPY